MENYLQDILGNLTPSELDELVSADFNAKAPRGAVKRIEKLAIEKAGLKAKKRVRLKPLIIAAAATIVLLMAGFTTAVVKGKHVFSFGTGDSVEQGFDLDLQSRELTIPDEFKPQDGETSFRDYVDMTPRELCETFGINPPFNDNFTDTATGEPLVEILFFDGEYTVNYTDAWFNFALYNKTVGRSVYFHAQYFANTEKMTHTSRYELMPGEPTEVVTLNNGARCMVSASKAVFSYDGAIWEINVEYDYPIPENYGELTRNEQESIIAEMIEAKPGIEAVKQVLSDMELL